MVMKNVSRNKFLLCFKPVVDIDQLVIDSKNQALKFRKKAALKHPVVPSSSPSSSSCSTSSDNNSLVLHSPRRNFSRAIKAVFFETILFKRVRDKKRLCDEESSSFSSQKTLRIIEHHDKLFITDGVSKTQDLKPDSFSSSCVSERKNPSLCSKNIKNQPNPNQESKVKSKKIDYSGVHLLIISLAVTVIWGKLCAIIFTSIWLYFMPRRRLYLDGKPGYGRKIVEEMSNKEQKKRVIMEGLLERNHRLSK